MTVWGEGEVTVWGEDVINGMWDEGGVGEMRGWCPGVTQGVLYGVQVS